MAKPTPPSARPAANPSTAPIGSRILSGIGRLLGIGGQIFSGPGAVGQQGGDEEAGLLMSTVHHMQKMVDAGKISNAEGDALLRELLRIYGTKQPAFKGTRHEQTDQHLALLQQAVISLMVRSNPNIPPGQEERIAAAVDAALGKPDYRNFDLEKLAAEIRRELAAQAAKSAKTSGGSPSAAGNAGSQPASGATPAASGAGKKGGGGSGSSSPPIAQGPNDDEDDDEEEELKGREAKRQARLPPKGTPEWKKLKAERNKGVRAKQALELQDIRAGGRGSGVWTDEQLQNIRNTGEFPIDVRWHHNPTVANRPELAADPSVVYPVRGGNKGHLDAHGGNYQNPRPKQESEMYEHDWNLGDRLAEPLRISEAVPNGLLTEFHWNDDNEPQRCVLYQENNLVLNRDLAEHFNALKSIYGDCIGGSLLQGSLKVATFGAHEIWGLYMLPMLQGLDPVQRAARIRARNQFLHGCRQRLVLRCQRRANVGL